MMLRAQDLLYCGQGCSEDGPGAMGMAVSMGGGVDEMFFPSEEITVKGEWELFKISENYITESCDIMVWVGRDL